MSTFSDFLGGSPLDYLKVYSEWDRAKQNSPSNQLNSTWDSSSYLTMQKDLISNQQKVIDALSSNSASVGGINFKSPLLLLGVAAVVGFLILRK